MPLRILRKIRSYFAIELLLFLVLLAAVITNLELRLTHRRQTLNRSLFFIALKNHPQLNRELLDTYESLNLEVVQETNLEKQILAASAKGKDQVVSPATPLPTLSGSALLKPNPATSSTLSPKRDIEVYTVRGGDTVGRIAAAYGISVETILSENNLTVTSYIQPGQELKILPTSGVKHVVMEGETISAIAKKYQVEEEDILEYNEIEIEDFILPGEELIIPGGTKKVPTRERRQYLADLQREDYKKIEVPQDYQGDGSELIWPMPSAYRLSQGFKRRHPGVDVPCRDCEIVSADDGIVELAGWQRGYGNTIVINHGSGVKTRYAHGKALHASVGDQVSQGQLIMTSGSTGRSTGPHLHFEVIQGGQFVNPLAVVPR